MDRSGLSTIMVKSIYHKTLSKNIEDITSIENNQAILRRMKNDDPELTSLSLCTNDDDDDEYRRNTCFKSRAPGGECYAVEQNDAGWLGHFVGNNTKLTTIEIQEDLLYGDDDIAEKFCAGLSRNRSVQKLLLNGVDLSVSNGGMCIQNLKPFLQNNGNLIDVEFVEIYIDAGGIHQLADALRRCKCKLKKISTDIFHEYSDEDVTDNELLVITWPSSSRRLEYH